jgi:hypothetical protein
MKDKGNSLFSDIECTMGSFSTAACIAMYSKGTTPETMNEGGIPRYGATVMIKVVQYSELIQL